MELSKLSLQEKIELYQDACEAYYQSEEAIMSDFDFDLLKEDLENHPEAQSLIQEVEPESDDYANRTKLSGNSGMISLKKTQVFGEFGFDQSHEDTLIKWLQNSDSTVSSETEVSVGWKCDGCALGLEYENGILTEAKTRGNFSVLDKLRPILPHSLPGYSGELRCEVVMYKSVFIDKYAEHYQNPRNLVSGVMNDINLDDPRIFDLTVIILNDGLNAINVEFVDEYQKYFTPQVMYLPYEQLKISSIQNFYKGQQLIRDSIIFPTDGLVVYLKNVTELLTQGKYPYHSMAIKFPPTKAITRINSIQWRLTKSGNWIPKAKLEPIILDGSRVSQTLLFNIGYIRETGAYPGALVEIGKNGDIIPYIQKVVEPGDSSLLTLPEMSTEVGIHLVANDSEGLRKERFLTGCACFGFLGFSRSSFRKIGEIPEINYDIIEIFNPENMRSIGEALGGKRTALKFIDKLSKLKPSLTIFNVIRFLQIPGCGYRTSKILAEHLSGIDVSFNNLERRLVEGFQKGNDLYSLTETSTDKLIAYGCTITPMEAPKPLADITFEMTGSPKDYDFSTKSEFLKAVSSWSHTKLGKGTTYLITDDKQSTSSKMKAAVKYGAEIITYGEAVAIHNTINR